MTTASLRQLEVFRLLMRVRNLTETARLLRISQPAISQALRGLESDFGFELFARSGGRVTPTDEATAILPEIERLFTQLSTLKSRVGELRDERAGSLSIATIPTLTNWLLPKAVAALRRERPHAQVRIETCDQPILLRLIKQEGADIGFTFSPIMEPGVAAEPIFQTRTVCLMLPDHPLGGRTVLRAADFAGEPLITLSPTTPPGLLLREALDREQHGDLDMIETNSANAAIGLVRERVGVALMDVLALYSGYGSELIAVPFEPEIPLVLTAVYSRNRPVARIVVRFLAHTRVAIERLVSELKSRELPGQAM
jgi:DNA-binding transcriptional LysR family regulator